MRLQAVMCHQVGMRSQVGRPSSAIKCCQLLLVSALMTACATEAPVTTTFDSSSGSVACEILGDGFVRSNGRRIPLEAFVLELRQATRQMAREELLRFLVTIRLAPDLPDGAAAKTASDGREYLLRQLQIMGVRQAGA
jgi:hypothetical protein